MFNTDYDWYANNSQYYFDYRVQCQYYGRRTYYKLNGWPALAAMVKIYHDDISTYCSGPMFVSPNPEAITYNTDYADYQHFPEITYAFEYLGITWYVGQDGYFWQDQTPVDDFGNIPTLSDYTYTRDRAGIIACAKAIIDAASVTVVAPSPAVYIPAMYQQVEYIESHSSGRSAIDTGITGEFACELDIQFTSNGYRQLMGVSQNDGEYIGITSSNEFEIGNAISGSDATVRSIIVYGHNQNEAFLNYGETVQHDSYYSYSSDKPMKLLTTSSNVDTYCCLAKIYRCKISDNSGNVVRDMYPVYKKSDNEVGMYDTITETFFGSMAAPFTEGPDVTPVVTTRRLALYANRLWEPLYSFTYTGAAQQFTLQPGEYLLECNGASGGHWSNYMTPKGGTSYGILNLQTQTTLYAVVGGDGGQPTSNGQAPGAGGFNGGGTGGISTSYENGPGGGGASDIRLTMQDEQIQLILSVPAEYDELEYLRSDSNSGYDQKYILTNYTPKANTKIEMKFIGHTPSNSYSACYGTREYYNNNFTFFFRSESNDYSLYEYNNSKVTSQGTSFPLDVEVKLIADGPIATVYDTNDQVILSITTTDPRFNPRYPMMIFTVNQDNNPTGDYSNMSFIEMKVYEGNDLVHYYVPVSDAGDNTSGLGLFDIVDQEVFHNAGGGSFTGGAAKTTKTEITVTKTLPTSVLTRFIVAGGAGGGTRLIKDFDQYSNMSAFGGGVNGGYPDSNNNDPNHQRYATQTSGYSFGVGMTGLTRTGGGSWSGEGAGGGGGGWYGGYSSGDPGNYDCTSCNGGGGSGYVLTSSSYKPTDYFYGYTSRLSEFYLTNTFMNSGSAGNANVKVYREVSSIAPGDIITAPCTGSVQQITLPKGKFKLKAVGGCGGMRNDQTSVNVARGGYAEGILNNQTNSTLYIRVGGSSVLAGQRIGASYIQPTFPVLSYNGGGVPHSYSDLDKCSVAGGGASDIRVGTDSLYARILVAGGGGGCGSSKTNKGGSGGGTTGETGTGNVPYTNAAAGGTQTESPEVSTPSCMGGFGYGGSSSDDYVGAGGGGWYGGNTSIYSSWEGAGGGGGSGYVLTSTSFKPTGYLLDESYYLTNTRLKTGFNTPTLGSSYVSIECLETASFGILASDGSGYKKFDAEHNTWVSYTPAGQTLTPDDFIDNGINSFPTDHGLTGTYSILMYDPKDTLNTAIFNIVPPAQHIDIKHYMTNVLRSISFDYDYDDSTTAVLIEHAVRRDQLGRQYLDIDIDVSFTDIPGFYPKFFDIIGYTMGSTIPNPTDPNIPSEHRLPIDLLPVRAVNRIPSKEKNYIGTTLSNQSTITSVQSSACFVKDRMVYSVTECNNNTFRFAKLDLVANQSTIIKDMPKSSFNNISIGDIFVTNSSVYITSSATNNTTTIYKASLESDNMTVSTINLSVGNRIGAKGKMIKRDTHDFIVMSEEGFCKVYTQTDSVTEYLKPGSAINSRYDFAIGEKYLLSTDTSQTDGVYLYSFADETWSAINSLSSVAANAACCYGGGKFYITEANFLHIIDEETLTVTTKGTSYSTLTPKTVDYANGYLYITIVETNVVYIYDIARNLFSTVGISFSPSSANATTGNYRPCTFNTYFFMGNMKLFACNRATRTKYNLGFKGDQFLIQTNEDDLEINDYTYNAAYVGFDSSSMFVMPGTITKPLEIIDVENMIKSVSISKSSYGQLSSVEFTKIE